MPKKTVNRKELRRQIEAAQAAEDAKPKRKAAKRKTRAKAASDGPKKLYWGVFNQSMKQVALYNFNQKKDAEKKATDLNKSGKSAHFVQKVKREIEEA